MLQKRLEKFILARSLGTIYLQDFEGFKEVLKTCFHFHLNFKVHEMLAFKNNLKQTQNPTTMTKRKILKDILYWQNIHS